MSNYPFASVESQNAQTLSLLSKSNWDRTDFSFSFHFFFG